jgi:uncharacterized membrane protein YphA (DoxX/SURF4 family)
MTEISLGILLVLGLLTRPAAFVAFLFLGGLWISELGTEHLKSRQRWEPASFRNLVADTGAPV